MNDVISDNKNLTYNTKIQYKYKMVPLKWEYSIASYAEFIFIPIHKWYKLPKSICYKKYLKYYEISYLYLCQLQVNYSIFSC